MLPSLKRSILIFGLAFLFLFVQLSAALVSDNSAFTSVAFADDDDDDKKKGKKKKKEKDPLRGNKRLREAVRTLQGEAVDLQDQVSSNDVDIAAAQATADGAAAAAIAAQTTADAANTAAANAQGTADAANTAAANAQLTADAANTAAANAQADADAAQTAADDAQAAADAAGDDAGVAQAAADDAQAAADDAQITANQAKADAATAQETADQAQADASTAQGAADLAQADASAAQGSADDAAADAAAAQGTANQAVSDAAAAQGTADQAVLDAAAAASASAAADSSQDQILQTLDGSLNDVKDAMDLLDQRVDAVETTTQGHSVSIAALQQAVDQLGTSIHIVGLSIIGLESTIALNTSAITDIQSNLNATNQEINDLKVQVTNHAASVDHAIGVLQNQTADLQNQINTLTANLTGQLATLQAAVNDNTGDISGLLVNVTSITAQILLMNSTLDNHETRIGVLEGEVADLQLVTVQLDARLQPVEQSAHTHNDGLCFTVTNTPSEDLTGNDWFDACVQAAQDGGTTVRIVLKDSLDNVVYDASGDIIGDWNQDQLTSTAHNGSQYHNNNNDRIITLDSGDKLMITGKSASNGGCGGHFGNGYGITLYPSAPNYIDNAKMLIHTYKDRNGYARSFFNWSPATEISWNNGTTFGTCSWTNNIGGVPGFEGTFEFYVN